MVGGTPKQFVAYLAIALLSFSSIGSSFHAHSHFHTADAEAVTESAGNLCGALHSHLHGAHSLAGCSSHVERASKRQSTRSIEHSHRLSHTHRHSHSHSHAYSHSRTNCDDSTSRLAIDACGSAAGDIPCLPHSHDHSDCELCKFANLQVILAEHVSSSECAAFSFAFAVGSFDKVVVEQEFGFGRGPPRV